MYEVFHQHLLRHVLNYNHSVSERGDTLLVMCGDIFCLNVLACEALSRELPQHRKQNGNSHFLLL